MIGNQSGTYHASRQSFRRRLSCHRRSHPAGDSRPPARRSGERRSACRRLSIEQAGDFKTPAGFARCASCGRSAGGGRTGVQRPTAAAAERGGKGRKKKGVFGIKPAPNGTETRRKKTELAER